MIEWLCWHTTNQTQTQGKQMGYVPEQSHSFWIHFSDGRDSVGTDLIEETVAQLTAFGLIEDDDFTVGGPF